MLEETENSKIINQKEGCDAFFEDQEGEEISNEEKKF